MIHQKVKHKIAIWPNTSTPRYILKSIERRDSNTCMWMFTVVLFRIAKMWTQTQMSISLCANKLNMAYPYNGYYAAKQKNEVHIHATVWMNREHMILSEGSHTQKSTCCMIPFIWSIPNKQIPENRKQIGIYPGQGMGRWGVTANGYGFLLGMMSTS